MKWDEFLKAPLRTKGVLSFPEDPESFTRRRPSHPRIFISYKFEDESFSAKKNLEHQNWVEWLTLNLQAFGVYSVWDKTIHSALQQNTEDSADAIWGEICRICVLTCSFFAPIITPGYLERITWKDGEKQKSASLGVSTGEYDQFKHLEANQQMAVVPILRKVNEHNNKFKLPSGLYNNGNLFDFAGNLDRSENSMTKVIDYIYENFTAQHPAMQMNERDLIELYIDWNRIHDEERRHKNLRDWKFHRSNVLGFLKAYDQEIKRDIYSMKGESSNAK